MSYHDEIADPQDGPWVAEVRYRFRCTSMTAEDARRCMHAVVQEIDPENLRAELRKRNINHDSTQIGFLERRVTVVADGLLGLEVPDSPEGLS